MEYSKDASSSPMNETMNKLPLCDDAMKLLTSVSRIEKEAIIFQDKRSQPYIKEVFWKNQNVCRVVQHDTEVVIRAVQDLVAGIFLEVKPVSSLIDHAIRLAHYAVNLNFESYVLRSWLPFVNKAQIQHSYLSFKSHVFGEMNIVPGHISLTKRDWFDTWCKRGDYNNLSREMKLFIIGLDDKSSLALWGPWFAAIVAASQYELTENLVNKIARLFSHLSKCYILAGIEYFFINPSYYNSWKPFLACFYDSIFSDCLKRSFYLGMIGLYYGSTLNSQMKELLNFFIIQPIRFYDMQLLTLVDQTCNEYKCKVTDLISITFTANTAESWIAYQKFYKAYMRAVKRLPEVKANSNVEVENKIDQLEVEEIKCDDSLWPFARIFDSKVFIDVSYSKNEYLCGMLALINDLRDDSLFKSESRNYESWKKTQTGTFYKELISIHSAKPLLSENDYQRCEYLRNALISLTNPVKNKEVNATLQK